MRAIRRICAIVALVAASAAPAQQDLVTPEALVASLAQSVAAGTPGISAAIGTRRGIVWTGVAGDADLDAAVPIDEADRFGIGSITKVFVAVVVLQLVEEGRLSLAATPASVLGDAAVRGIANAREATVEQLLAHTAGIPSWEDDASWIRKGRGAGLEPAHRWSKTEALDYIRGKPALASPGVRFSYSNSGYTLLGLMIEKATGNEAAAEIRRRILAPLGLRDTYLEGFEPGDERRVPHRYHHATPHFVAAAGMAPSFSVVRDGLIDTGPTDLSDEWTAGGMMSTPRDLVTFAIALRDGCLLKPTSLAFMQRWAPAVGGMRVGHGLFETSSASGKTYGHTGGVLGFSANLWWSSESDAVIAVLSNVGTMHSGAIPQAGDQAAFRLRFAALALRYAAQHQADTRVNAR